MKIAASKFGACISTYMCARWMTCDIVLEQHLLHTVLFCYFGKASTNEKLSDPLAALTRDLSNIFVKGSKNVFYNNK